MAIGEGIKTNSPYTDDTRLDGALRLFRLRCIARDGLKHAYAVALGVNERNILAHAGYRHRLAEHFTARMRHLPYRFLDIIDRAPKFGLLTRGVYLVPLPLFPKELRHCGTFRLLMAYLSQQT